MNRSKAHNAEFSTAEAASKAEKAAQKLSERFDIDPEYITIDMNLYADGDYQIMALSTYSTDDGAQIKEVCDFSNLSAEYTADYRRHDGFTFLIQHRPSRTDDEWTEYVLEEHTKHK